MDCGQGLTCRFFLSSPVTFHGVTCRACVGVVNPFSRAAGLRRHTNFSNSTSSVASADPYSSRSLLSELPHRGWMCWCRPHCASTLHLGSPFASSCFPSHCPLGPLPYSPRQACKWPQTIAPCVPSPSLPTLGHVGPGCVCRHALFSQWLFPQRLPAWVLHQKWGQCLVATTRCARCVFVRCSVPRPTRQPRPAPAERVTLLL